MFVADPSDAENIPLGKQTLEPSHIFYRPCSGIWQSVWIEPVPDDHITRLDVAANADGKGTIDPVVTSKEDHQTDATLQSHRQRDFFRTAERTC